MPHGFPAGRGDGVSSLPQAAAGGRGGHSFNAPQWGHTPFSGIFAPQLPQM